MILSTSSPVRYNSTTPANGGKERFRRNEHRKPNDALIADSAGSMRVADDVPYLTYADLEVVGVIQRGLHSSACTRGERAPAVDHIDSDGKRGSMVGDGD